MSVYVVVMMPFVVLILGIVVSLIVMGGIADADQQARRLRSQKPVQKENGDLNIDDEKILQLGERRRAN